MQAMVKTRMDFHTTAGRLIRLLDSLRGRLAVWPCVYCFDRPSITVFGGNVKQVLLDLPYVYYTLFILYDVG